MHSMFTTGALTMIAYWYVECPRGPLSMCITMYVVHMVCPVFLLLYPCCYIHDLWSCLPGSQKLWFIDTTYLLPTFLFNMKQIETMTLWLNIHSANILRDMKYNMPSSHRGPLADLRYCVSVPVMYIWCTFYDADCCQDGTRGKQPAAKKGGWHGQWGASGKNRRTYRHVGI